MIGLTFNNCDSFGSWFLQTHQVDKNNISILHINIRSIKKHWDTLVVQLKQPDGTFGFDVLCLTEINCNENEFSTFNIDGFTKCCVLRTVKKGGGLALFYNSARLEFSEFQYNSQEFENLSGTFKITGTCAGLSVVAVYRPPDTSVIRYIAELHAECSFH